jgi:PHD/YefM family antitoxin component YafN of YafNO toxin-antitoxin module
MENDVQEAVVISARDYQRMLCLMEEIGDLIAKIAQLAKKKY